jgi:hypothetical protein
MLPHPPGRSSRASHVCDDCGKVYTRGQDLTRHIPKCPKRNQPSNQQPRQAGSSFLEAFQHPVQPPRPAGTGFRDVFEQKTHTSKRPAPDADRPSKRLARAQRIDRVEGDAQVYVRIHISD